LVGLARFGIAALGVALFGIACFGIVLRLAGPNFGLCGVTCRNQYGDAGQIGARELVEID